MVVAAPWTVDAATVARSFGTDPVHGLASAEARRRRADAGPNELVERGHPAPWQTLLRQFANTMTVVLAAAAVVTVVVGEQIDAIVIGVIVVLNASIGFAQERRAEQAMAALRRLTTTRARVVRDGTVLDVAAPELVPGDVVHVAAGDVIPADVRLVTVHGLRVDESTLTGEAEPVAKLDRALPDVGPSLIAERLNMVFKGTSATYGRATGVVVATGMASEIGRIAALIEPADVEATPLQQRLAVVGRRMATAAIAVCVTVFVSGVATGEPADDMFLTAVSLAVAAIPEGLPAIVTVALALGARRMATRRALVRRLLAVETLGSVTVICTDKTGTLTENRMLVERVWTPVGVYRVTGRGYAPDGELLGSTDPAVDPFVARIAEVAAGCNDAVLHAPRHDATDWTVTGDPTEGALLALAAKLGVERPELDRAHPRVQEIAFDADRRRMTTVHRADGGWWLAVKGALSAVEPLLSPSDGAVLRAATDAADELADAGYRVLALAERRNVPTDDSVEAMEHGLELVGLVGMTDPPRAEAASAIATCRQAGITPVMITGDDPRTAWAIAGRIGLVDGASEGVVVTGRELDDLDDGELAGHVADVRVFARTTPEQKLRIVTAWKAAGAIVAMTGDGVNDAPALRRADIGVAMGQHGTDVSKEAADMVLADDDFATIVHAVEEGRRIYDSVRRFVRYLLSTNSGEIWVMFLAPLIGLPVPLLPIQILWINLVTDGLPAVALGLEPAEPDVMRRQPRPPRESILAGGLWQQALWSGLLMAAIVLPLQAGARAADWPWQTMVFSTLALLQLANALALRSERRSFFRLDHRSNPWIGRAVAVSVAAQLATVYVPALQDVFDTEPLSAVQLGIVLTLSAGVFVAVELEKLLGRRRRLSRASSVPPSPTTGR